MKYRCQYTLLHWCFLIIGGLSLGCAVFDFNASDYKSFIIIAPISAISLIATFVLLFKRYKYDDNLKEKKRLGR